MIILRELQTKDAPLMLEWMHDSEFQKCFQRKLLDTTTEDAISFILASAIPEVISDGDNLHFAVTDETDEYLGTISLKDINLTNLTAEYAISMRAKTHGSGIAEQATRLILDKAFNEYGLHRVYLNVYSDNIRAIRFYEKCGFINEGEFRDHLRINDCYVSLKWYGMLDKDFNDKRK